MFENRREAGRRLAEALKGSLDAGALVLGVPRGGVTVAAEVARELGLELDVVVVRKIGAPGNPEYAVAAVDEEGRVIGGGRGLVGEEYLQHAAEAGREEIARRLRTYRGGSPPATVAGRTVVLVDDGIATGMTLLAALESLRRRGAGRIVVATPVAAPEAAQRIAEEADEFTALEVPHGFSAVGQFYADFRQTGDDEVIASLHAARTGK
ncbi:MAG: phosphoribosyltransferase [Coriobacteriia bacterium]|nr:phosphoribosyltransferase [Coriobacteriia bacterium]